MNPNQINFPEMVVEKSSGVTQSERKLVALGYQTFLRLWSYPNPYKMQPNGKELCDLLIVFDNQIIIFSDKECIYKNTGNSQIDWRRWYKRAIQKSAEQLVGAKTWITRCPDRIAIDAKCSKPLPLKIKVTPETKFYLIAVAHGANEQCKAFFKGGDGGLFVDSRIVGEKHIDSDCQPFQIGRVTDDLENFIHVFDDSSYANVLCELDTIQDFLRYLNMRQKLLCTKGVIAESENDILAQYLEGVIKNQPNYLQEKCQDYTDISFSGGMLDELRNSKRYNDWRKKLKKSYFWDGLLQKTFYYIENGLSAMTTTPSIQAQSELFKLMARVDRAHRYCLSDGFLSFLSTTKSDQRGTRIIYSPDEPDVCYFLFLLPRKDYMKDEEYRKVRCKMLYDYSLISKADYPQFSHIIGVAHESAEGVYTSEDFLYLDAHEWSQEQQAEAVKLKKEYIAYGLLQQREMFEGTYFKESIKMKGHDRNKPCPCGSGKKFKNCCGRYL